MFSPLLKNPVLLIHTLFLTVTWCLYFLAVFKNPVLFLTHTLLLTVTWCWYVLAAFKKSGASNTHPFPNRNLVLVFSCRFKKIQCF